MTDKQIFAALEISDCEIRLIVGEFFHARFNIIKVERVPCAGLSYDGIKDPDSVTDAIKCALEKTGRLINADIQKVILAVPAFRMKRFFCRASTTISGPVTAADIRTALAKAQKLKTSDDYAIVQMVPGSYAVNGVNVHNPIGVRGTELTVGIDVLAIDKQLAYDLVACVENAGLEILDIFIDVYAFIKEAALAEQPTDNQIIILKTERESTTLALLKKGRLMTATVIPGGIGSIASALTEKYGIDAEIAVELLKYSCQLNQSEFSADPVYIWSAGEETRTLSEAEIRQTVDDYVNFWLERVRKTCEPILQAGQTTAIITGEAGETNGLAELLAKQLGAEVTAYIPDTLGGRNACLAACLGLFYAYQDRFPILNKTESSLDMDAFIKSVSYREKKADDDKEDTLTNKIKGLFREGRKK